MVAVGRLDGVEVDEGNALDRMINMRNEVHCSKCKGHLVRVRALLAWRRRAQ
jgi:hypothetical protein